jgi:hypothetical protein
MGDPKPCKIGYSMTFLRNREKPWFGEASIYRYIQSSTADSGAIPPSHLSTSDRSKDCPYERRASKMLQTHLFFYACSPERIRIGRPRHLSVP